MKIKTLIIGSLLIAGILTGCNGQSATTTIETETTTEIESTTESESTTSEIALENEKGIASFNASQGKVEGEEIELTATTAETFDAKKDGDVNSTGSDTTLGADEYQGEDFAPAPEEKKTTGKITIGDDVPADYRKKLEIIIKDLADGGEAADLDGDKVINKDEAQMYVDFMWDDSYANTDNSGGGSSSSGGTTGGSNDWGGMYDQSQWDDGGVPPEVDYSKTDMSGASTTAEVY